MNKLLVLTFCIMFVTGCTLQPIKPWQGEAPTQMTSMSKWIEILNQTKMIEGAKVEEGTIQTSILVERSSLSKEDYDLYIFTKESSYAHPAAAKISFYKGNAGGENPEFHFIKVGYNPNYKRFVTEMLMAGVLSKVESDKTK